jgi:hypothetical protein
MASMSAPARRKPGAQRTANVAFALTGTATFESHNHAHRIASTPPLPWSCYRLTFFSTLARASSDQSRSATRGSRSATLPARDARIRLTLGFCRESDTSCRTLRAIYS